MERRKWGDLGSGLALAALGLYIVAQARQWVYLGPEGPGAGFFPMWYGIAILALSVALVVSSLRRRSDEAGKTDWRKTGRALSAWAALAVSFVLCKPLGFLVSFALLAFFIVAVLYRRPLKVAAVVAAAGAAAFYLLFPLALGVALPVGVLGF
ncbi:MAG: tripartite tricarboxylate transporter TctB family protein [Burkholderiales bacterium]